MNLLLSIYRVLVEMLTGQKKFQTDLLSKLDELLVEVREIKMLMSPEPVPVITFTVILDDGTIKEGITHMEMTADQKVATRISITNPVTGKPAKVDGTPVWASSDETVITVVPDTDGMSAEVFGVVQGSARVTVTADADLGSGVNTISGALDFVITPGATPTITLIAGTPENQ